MWANNFNNNNSVFKRDEEKEYLLNNKIFYIKNKFDPIDKVLRGKSDLYTFVRFKIKTFILNKGYEASGYKAIELFPSNNENIIFNSSKAINVWAKKLKNLNIQSCVVILPYEMQISKNAANKYGDLGVNFDEEFLNFKTQEIIKSSLDDYIETLIIKDEFIENIIGTYFVYNKGDKIDFNHPNRQGHYIIAKEISKNKLCQ